jgi:hypothetical protein
VENVSEIQQSRWTADILLRNWGHDPAVVRRLARSTGRHWARTLNKAEFWARHADALQSALDVFIDMDESLPQTPETLATIEKLERSLRAITCLRGEAIKHKGVWLATCPAAR